MASKKILVTGAYGMLGRDLVPFLQNKGHNVTPTDADHMSLLESTENIREKLEPIQPEIIIHAAAYTNVDGAESDPDLAMAVNKDGTRKIAEVAQQLGAAMVYISTDFVFDGLKREPYEPSDRPNPISTYGLSKYYGELMVSELLDQYYIVRTSWLYGIHNKNFVQWVLDTARSGGTLNAVSDWIGSPTWTGSLCAAIESIFNTGEYGIYHGSNDGEISRYDQAVAICKMAELSPDCVKPVSASNLSLAAARPVYSAMHCPKITLPSWETALQSYLEQYRQVVSP
jgi:dTDP-4-dehydrorhamnose reductase